MQMSAVVCMHYWCLDQLEKSKGNKQQMSSRTVTRRRYCIFRWGPRSSQFTQWWMDEWMAKVFWSWLTWLDQKSLKCYEFLLLTLTIMTICDYSLNRVTHTVAQISESGSRISWYGLQCVLSDLKKGKTRASAILDSCHFWLKRQLTLAHFISCN